MDFIITWVDGNDSAWKKELAKFKNEEGDSSYARFRDWDNLQYWFRGIEKFAPWVNKVHFVTWGHVPQWLNIDHPKLNIVKHEDYIPKQYLPTFNSRTLEFNFNRIENLSNEYVYFNDDTFLISPIEEEFFFKNGKICDHAHLAVITGDHAYSKILLENLLVTSKHFSKFEAVKEKPFNWFNLKYGKSNIMNLLLLLVGRSHTGFESPHLAQPTLKSSLDMLWEKEFDKLDETCSCHIREFTNVTQLLLRNWELCSNNFIPVRKRGRNFNLLNRKVLSQAKSYIENQTKPMICINDSEKLTYEEFLEMSVEIKKSFEKILPNKSTFEK